MSDWYLKCMKMYCLSLMGKTMFASKCSVVNRLECLLKYSVKYLKHKSFEVIVGVYGL